MLAFFLSLFVWHSALLKEGAEAVISSSSLTVIQAQNTFQSSAATSITVNMSTTVGDAVVCTVREGTNNTITWTMSDSAGQTGWKQTASGYASANYSNRGDVRYITNSAALTSITARYSSSVAPTSMVCLELNGAATSSVEDASVNAANSKTSGPLTTTDGNDILIYGLYLGSNASTWAAAPGYAIPPNGTNARMGVEYKVVSAVQNATIATMTTNSTGSYFNVFVAFKASGGVVPPPDTTPPTVPTGLAASKVTTSTLTLSWTASADPDSTVAGYKVYRNGTQAGTVTGTSFNDTGLAANTTYSYTVAAYDPSNNVSAQSTPLSVTTASPDTIPPSVSITSPAPSSTISRVITVSVSAMDDTSVSKVELFVDGSLKAIQTTSPYTFSLDTTTLANGAHTLSAKAYDPAGNVGAAVPVTVTVNNPTGTVSHHEYVFVPGAVDVYDMDNNFALVKSVSMPQTKIVAALGIRGAVASAATNMLYVSYGSGSGGNMLKYNLLTDQVVWSRTYPFGIDSMSISPDGTKIYMPTGEGAYTQGVWEVLDANTGNVIGSINSGGRGPHNTTTNLSGTHIYMGPRYSGYLVLGDTNSLSVIRNIGPVTPATVRPFAIDMQENYAYITVSDNVGFYVANINTGQILYWVCPPGYCWTSGPFNNISGVSHGISLSPDGKELYVLDLPYNRVHVFNVTGLPNSAPVDAADIALSCTLSGEGWLQHSRDGRFVFVGDCGDVINTATRQVVANIPAMDNTRMFNEVDFQNGAVYFTPLSRN